VEGKQDTRCSNCRNNNEEEEEEVVNNNKRMTPAPQELR
jgi:hypothetical protein